MMLDNEHGWASIDFIAAFMIILVTIPGIIAIIEERVDTANRVQEIAEAKVLSENIAERIEMVCSGGNGCSITYKMPPTTANKSYIVHVNSSGVFIRFNGKMGSAFISPVKISNNLRYDYNVFMEANKTYNISNIKNEFNYDCIIIKQI
ncbi:hypothetical protein [Methanobacterium spitsbergense]|uniref:Class III signal peptide-containing protein n=1 Tax=Methanobacterium spitsbergense TaxID=2874285 RepID=A0A8T5V0P4_9EURY|nr:hypothetical protein [Methanobacterium spitsbergense]MBZ2166559.1 hypothetical protein [Methanobacterium spitsbergense]